MSTATNTTSSTNSTATTSSGTSKGGKGKPGRVMGRGRGVVFAVARWAHRFPWRPAATATGATGLGAGIDALGWTWYDPVRDAVIVMVLAGVAVLVGCGAWWWVRYVGRPWSTRMLIARRAELDQRSGGVATWLDIAELAGPTALRLRAPILRPTYRDLTRRQRRRLDPRELGVEIVRLGRGRWPGQQVWSSCEDATLRIAGPRAGKTISLSCHAQDAPGALITTSTRLDLAEMVHRTRTGKGRVHIFNPAGYGALGSTVRWRVLGGCEDFTTAQRRATDLAPESGSGEGERWDKQARRILALLLHAAALAGASMREVARWADTPTVEEKQAIAVALLSGGEGGRDRLQSLRDHWSNDPRPRTSITMTMAVPIAWVNDDRARVLGDAGAGDPDLLDITTLIEGGQTLHLIGHEDNTSIAPLIAALVAEIAYVARALAEARPSGRLDPPVTMVLDEADRVCPVPLDRWTADMGGRGATIHIAVQSLGQLRQRWGDNGATTILANTALMWFGGSPSSADLRDISALTGEHRMRVIGPDHGGDTGVDGQPQGEYRWVPVLSPGQIRALEPGQVLLLKRGLRTIVGRAPQITDRKDWAPVSLRDTRLPAATTPNATTGGGRSEQSAAERALARWTGRARPEITHPAAATTPAAVEPDPRAEAEPGPQETQPDTAPGEGPGQRHARGGPSDGGDAA